MLAKADISNQIIHHQEPVVWLEQTVSRVEKKNLEVFFSSRCPWQWYIAIGNPLSLLEHFTGCQCRWLSWLHQASPCLQESWTVFSGRGFSWQSMSSTLLCRRLTVWCRQLFLGQIDRFQITWHFWCYLCAWNCLVSGGNAFPESLNMDKVFEDCHVDCSRAAILLGALILGSSILLLGVPGGLLGWLFSKGGTSQLCGDQ